MEWSFSFESVDVVLVKGSRLNKKLTILADISGQAVPIPRHSQTCAKSARLVTLETKMNARSKYYHTYKRTNK